MDNQKERPGAGSPHDFAAYLNYGKSYKELQKK